MKNILLPTDFSENAWNALQYSVSLFAKVPCAFFLLNTYQSAMPLIGANLVNREGALRLLEHMKEDSENGLEKWKEKIQEKFKNPKHTFESISVEEPLVPCIKNTVKALEISLLIMGTKGASGLNEIFIGSNTVRVIQNMKLCPVLVIPENIKFVKPKEIAFPTDFNRFFSDGEMKPLVELAKLFNSSIKIVHINKEETLSDVQQYNLMMLKRHLKTVDHYTFWLPKFEKIASAITIFVEDLDIDVLAMVNYNHSIIEKITHEPVIKKIAFNITVPFLVLPEAGY